MKYWPLAVIALAADLLLGDPSWLPHPVVIMGWWILRLESLLRKVFPKTAGGELAAGGVLAAALPAGTFLFCHAALWTAGRVHPALAALLAGIWGWQALAAKGLLTESGRVRRALEQGTLEDARRAVGRIVGRDTGSLTEEGVIRAAVETVAENFSDGVTAPLLFLVLGGAPLALCYKAVNTMDSMVGYKNEQYLYFGRAAARLDDAANYLPSRLSALLLIGAAALCREDAPQALRIWRRDRRKHESPNSAQTESAMAGALGIALGGPAAYFGKRKEKPWLGDPRREPVPEDIGRAGRMMITGSLLALALLPPLWQLCQAVLSRPIR